MDKETGQIVKTYAKLEEAYGNEFGVKGNLSRKTKGIVSNKKEQYKIVYIEDIK